MSKFTLYNEHNLNKLKRLGDPLADEAVEFLVHLPQVCIEINSWEKIPEIMPAHFPNELIHFFSHIATPPKFVNSEKIIQAQRFFEANGTLYLTLLGFFSLPYSYAFADGAQVLIRSKRILEDVGKRLTETAFFVLDTFRPNSFVGSADNLLTLAKVRLIHAFSRYFIKNHAPDWNPDWGTPINQEELLHTNLVFGFLVMRSMRKIGIIIPEEEVSASLHYWKLVGYYLGIDVANWPDTSREAYFLEKNIRNRHLESSDAGKRLTKALLAYYMEFFQNPVATRLVEDLVAFLLGKNAGEAVGLKRPVSFAKPVYQLLLQSNLFGTSGQPISYTRLRKLFETNSQKQYGSQVRISIPVIPSKHSK